MTDVDQFSSSTEIDQESITKTPNGELQVDPQAFIDGKTLTLNNGILKATDPEIIFADFEKEFGEWYETSGSNGKINRYNGGSDAHGDYHMELETDTNGNYAELKRDSIDVTGIDQLTYEIYWVNDQSYGTLYVEVNGTEVFSGSNSQGSTTEHTIDVSNQQEISMTVRAENTSGQYYQPRFDYLHALPDFPVTKIIDDGSGGAV